ncbi:hypothetical protein R3W88_033398 [Solanum pinnatisectum]|uniref:Uncharacterized protein n=1 Tax=Solanum pinnatisectum TaxID=50273 RepID=A0AAV9K255_9SOLN|nr:hypothetical protein R3W88_033398 [Solanum pinnatisectum]
MPLYGIQCLPIGQERSACACVSKRWFMLLSSMRKDEIVESNGIEGEGYLVRSLFYREATYFRLTAIVVGTVNRFPTLRDLSFWNVSFVGYKGLSEISLGCHLLEKLDHFQCPTITDKSLLDFAKNCRAMTSLTINSCSDIGNDLLKVVGQYFLNLKIVV